MNHDEVTYTALDSARSYKPLDTGNGLVTGSVNDQGLWVSLNTTHPVHGYVTLSCAKPFPEDQWYNPAFVRRYRASLAARESAGFGWRFGPDPAPARCGFLADAIPQVSLTLTAGVNARITTFAPLMSESPASGAVQICDVINDRDDPYQLMYSWGGTFTLARSSYAQLTEGGPIARPADSYVSTLFDGRLVVENRGLEWAICVIGAPSHEERRNPSDAPPVVQLDGSLDVAPHSSRRLITYYGVGITAEEAERNAQTLAGMDVESLLDDTLSRWSRIIANVATNPPDAHWFAARSVVYVLGCCAAPVGETTCIITDHQLLPLAWTRDSYYEIQPFFALYRQACALGGDTEIVNMAATLVRRHLLWLFEVAERPGGAWGRAYLTNGRCKDGVYQLDQQCYPLLELAEYWKMTGDAALVQRLRQHLNAVLEQVLARRASAAWLFPTSETPADDHVAMPYHFSSQIVVWRTLRALAELNAAEPFSNLALAEMADMVRRDVLRHMVVEHQGRRLFCYLTDLHGGYQVYHDANDLPTALAPAWGFCAADDPVWRATMAFAFSEVNVNGYYSGCHPGLGSVHTPHPWPLGAVQDLLVARSLGDDVRWATAWQTLRDRACWDGLFCEAYDETSGAVASRHWFAWPGAALAMVMLK